MIQYARTAENIQVYANPQRVARLRRRQLLARTTPRFVHGRVAELTARLHRHKAFHVLGRDCRYVFTRGLS